MFVWRENNIEINAFVDRVFCIAEGQKEKMAPLHLKLTWAVLGSSLASLCKNSVWLRIRKSGIYG
ncbi:MAG TPA: hypothetical protein DEF07_04180 [Nitrosomonas sp.]|nr:hypothetical protein [Nitrosomonas sp.]